PMTDWPDRLRRALGDHTYVCPGGHEFDGREISALDVDELRRVASEIGEAGVASVAVTSVFSPVNPEMETTAAAILTEELPGVKVSLSREIGRVGLFERENATILNASLRPLADRVFDGFEEVVARAGVRAPVFISQNDGTLLGLDYARRYPVATFASGPTNSMRGAAFLSGVENGVVIDVGGTTTDVGILVGGFPREASVVVHVSGVMTNFRMPDVLSLGIGGGSLIGCEGDRVTVGPESVGYRLDERALVFGGPDLTATDIAVAAGLASIGDRDAADRVGRDVVRKALDRIRQDVAGAVDRLKTSPDPVVAIVVGGGSILLEDDLPGVSEMVRPDNFAVANAIGAAIAQVGGEVDRIYSLDDTGREEALESARCEAVDRAIVAGADPATVEVVDIEEVPLAYLPSNAVRIRMKAVGDLELSV
ncbi:MAG: hydantoinase/oxoprolinase family protein, partial [bacterium]|nr:hydantoinase/oxoprolinase family protein [bacterium]